MYVNLTPFFKSLYMTTVKAKGNMHGNIASKISVCIFIDTSPYLNFSPVVIVTTLRIIAPTTNNPNIEALSVNALSLFPIADIKLAPSL